MSYEAVNNVENFSSLQVELNDVKSDVHRALLRNFDG
jgi:hypothetical protein